MSKGPAEHDNTARDIWINDVTIPIGQYLKVKDPDIFFQYKIIVPAGIGYYIARIFEHEKELKDYIDKGEFNQFKRDWVCIAELLVDKREYCILWNGKEWFGNDV